MLLALLAAAPAAPALAAEAGQYRIAVTPVAGYRMGGEFDEESDNGDTNGAKVKLDDDGMAGLIINLPFDTAEGDAYTEWEFYFSRQTAGLEEAPGTVDPRLELEITHYLLGGTYVGGGETVRPYLAAGIGAARLEPDAAGYDSDTVFGFGIGVGAQVLPASRVGLRFEGRMLGSVIDSDSAIFCRSGPEGAGCAFRASGDLLLQWEVFAGITLRL